MRHIIFPLSTPFFFASVRNRSVNVSHLPSLSSPFARMSNGSPLFGGLSSVNVFSLLTALFFWSVSFLRCLWHGNCVLICVFPLRIRARWSISATWWWGGRPLLFPSLVHLFSPPHGGRQNRRGVPSSLVFWELQNIESFSSFCLNVSFWVSLPFFLPIRVLSSSEKGEITSSPPFLLFFFLCLLENTWL